VGTGVRTAGAVPAAIEAAAAVAPAEPVGPALVGPLAFLPRKSTTSDLVSRPSRPLAGMAAASRRFSSMSRRTEGLSFSLPASVPVALSSSAAGTSLAATAEAAAGAAAACAPSSISARSCPGVTTVPFGTLTSRNTPLAGAGTSSTTLSVSRSARFSSRLTASPGFLCQATSVASVMDSGNCGTLISVITSLDCIKTQIFWVSLLSWAEKTLRTLLSQRCRGCRLAARGGSGAADEPCCLSRGILCCRGMQRGVDQRLLLGLVNLADARGGRRRRRAAGVEHDAPLAQRLLQAVADLVPGALVLRLLLTPHHLTQIRIACEHRLVVLGRERVELLDAYQCHIAYGILAPRLQQIEVDLAAAEDHPAYSLRGQVIALADHPRKAAAGQLLEAGNRQVVPQQALRRHDDQRLAEGLQHLAAQHVEHLCGRGGHAYLHVGFRTKLQVAFEPRGGMLGPGSFVAVRQEEHEAAVALPLRLAGADELNDDDLGAIGEVAVLALP